jgi:hypothetical protein
MEDTTIRKVFHDCRRDSSALHLNGICTRNAADTSVTFSMIQQITYFDQWKQQQKPVVPTTDPKKALKDTQEKEKE